jgi:hypothetical protein
MGSRFFHRREGAILGSASQHRAAFALAHRLRKSRGHRAGGRQTSFHVEFTKMFRKVNVEAMDQGEAEQEAMNVANRGAFKMDRADVREQP